MASDCNGNREQIKNGVDGILCELDARKIAAEIQALIKDPEKRRQLAEAAEKKIFSDEKDMEKLLELTE